MNNELAPLQDYLTPYLNASRLVVAFSGGVDSTVLLHQLSELKKHEKLPELCALHIHHGLSKNADSWQLHCQKICEQLGVTFATVNVTLSSNSKKSTEELAREERYRVFGEFLQKNDVLLMAHHQDDQAETLLLRLLRGAGPKGLAAMPQMREMGVAHLCRPFINMTRQEIESYAQAHKLVWIEDESNADNQFDRNFLRNAVLPIIKERWPNYAQAWARSAGLCKDVDDLCNEWGWLDWQNVQGSKPGTLSVTGLQELSQSRQRNVVRYWLAKQSFSMPSQAQLETLLQEVMTAKEDATPLLTWPGVEIRRYQNNIYAMQPLAFAELACVQWDMKSPLAIHMGTLMAQPKKGEGIAFAKITNPITVRYRQGGERCKPAGRVGSHPVKKLFQEYNVEPWLRDGWPLIYMGETLIAAPSLWICEGIEAQKKEEGCIISLQLL